MCAGEPGRLETLRGQIRLFSFLLLAQCPKQSFLHFKQCIKAYTLGNNRKYSRYQVTGKSLVLVSIERKTRDWVRVAQTGKVSAAQTWEPGSGSRHHIKNQALWQKRVISVLRKGMEADTWSWPSRQPGLTGKSQVLVRDQFQKARRAAPEGQHPGLTSGLHMHVHANPQCTSGHCAVLLSHLMFPTIHRFLISLMN